jgi:hypothetical protein
MASLTDSDILFSDEQGRPVAAVEVRNHRALTAEVATALRRALAEQGLLPDVRFFLLVSQDVGFIWDKLATLNADAAPVASFPMSDVIACLSPKLGERQRLRNSELGLLVLNWLASLRPGNPKTEAERVLDATGFLDAVRRGTKTLVFP